jgi:hypothetical protein
LTTARETIDFLELQPDITFTKANYENAKHISQGQTSLAHTPHQWELEEAHDKQPTGVSSSKKTHAVPYFTKSHIVISTTNASLAKKRNKKVDEAAATTVLTSLVEYVQGKSDIGPGCFMENVERIHTTTTTCIAEYSGRNSKFSRIMGLENLYWNHFPMYENKIPADKQEQEFTAALHIILKETLPKFKQEMVEDNTDEQVTLMTDGTGKKHEVVVETDDSTTASGPQRKRRKLLTQNANDSEAKSKDNQNHQNNVC